jgi:hypothetical protein
MQMAQVQADHSIKFVADLGKVEPWWLKNLGVDLAAKQESKQYLPTDDPKFTEFLKS